MVASQRHRLWLSINAKHLHASRGDIYIPSVWAHELRLQADIQPDFRLRASLTGVEPRAGSLPTSSCCQVAALPWPWLKQSAAGCRGLAAHPHIFIRKFSSHLRARALCRTSLTCSNLPWRSCGRIAGKLLNPHQRSDAGCSFQLIHIFTTTVRFS